MNDSQRSAIMQSNPGAGYDALKQEIDEAVARVLQSHWYILGKEVSAFEEEFARYVGTSFAVGVASGTDALTLSLKACGVGPGDSVLTVSHTAVATVAAIELAGAVPVFVDVDPENFGMSPEKLEEAISKSQGKRLKAVVPVHLYGHPADIEAITALANRFGLYVIEDCAQSHGAEWRNRKTGTWGNIGAFSFYPTKNLGALGDGGCIVTNDPFLAEQVGLLREYGWKERYISSLPGANSRLDEIQAAILRVKLKYLNRDNDRRRRIANRYGQGLGESGLLLPKESPAARHVYHQYVIRAADRDGLRNYLKDRSIGVAVHYPAPVHQQPAYRHLTSGPPLAQTEAIGREILSLPIYPELSEHEVVRVIDAIRSFYD
jgi:dTDP-4-amino-4,6-dideoxygalactose transaminase